MMMAAEPYPVKATRPLCRHSDVPDSHPGLSQRPFSHEGG